jgi:hypothetical protein
MTENKIHPDDIAAYIQDNGLLKNNIDLANMVNFFAQLIVQECAEVIFETPVKYTEIDIMHIIRDRVREHFGVEP